VLPATRDRIYFSAIKISPSPIFSSNGAAHSTANYSRGCRRRFGVDRAKSREQFRFPSASDSFHQRALLAGMSF
jgi:hypothetical protein